MSRMIRDVLGASVLSAVALAGYAAGAAPLPVLAGGQDEIVAIYPDQADVLVAIEYRNAASQRSRAGEVTIETDFGPVVVHIAIGSPEEILTVREWPQQLYPETFQIRVPDGEAGVVRFLAPMF